MKQPRTYGYDRQAKVPAIAGTTPKLCKTCQSWFAARKREQRCDNCLPASLKRRRTAKAHYTELTETDAQRGSAGRTGSISSGGETTRKRRSSRTNVLVTGTVSDGGALCMELAREAAERIDYPKGRPQPMGRALKRYYVERAVSAGKQGRCDLECLVTA